MLSFTLNKLQFLANEIFNLREEIQEDGEQKNNTNKKVIQMLFIT